MNNMYTMGMILRETVDGIGYGSSMTVASKMQKHVVNISSSLVDSLMVTTSKDRVTDFAVGYGNVVTEMCEMGMSSSVVNFLNNLNQKRLSAGLEVMLGTYASDGVSVQYLTTFRKCGGSTGLSCDSGGIPVAGSEGMMLECLRGNGGTANVTIDYVGTKVFAASQMVSCASVATKLCVVYTLEYEMRRVSYEKVVMNAVNVVNPTMESTELLMYNAQGVVMTSLTHGKQCVAAAASGGKCRNDSTAIQAMINPTSDVMLIGPSYWSEDVMAASAYLPNTGIYFVLEVEMDLLKGVILTTLGTAGTVINNKLNGSMEILLGEKVYVNGTAKMEFLIEPRFWSQCAPNCRTSGDNSPMVKAAVKCINGVESGLTDYRGASVLAAYQCIPSLGLGVEIKIDTSEVLKNTLVQLAEYANLQNGNEPSTLELMVADYSAFKAGVASWVSNFLNKPGLDCRYSDCSVDPSLSQSMLKALAGGSGIVDEEKDYMGKTVMSAYGYSNDLKVGIVLKRDIAEIVSPIVTQLLILLASAFGISLIGVAVEFISARIMLRTIEETWEHARESIEKQKENFEHLVSALYPKFVTERLLAGDPEIVLEIPDATVFFSDICNFTAISNNLSAQEFLQWIGYTFRVMDHVADFHRIFKVKTIGDAYFALSGMPDMVVPGEKDEHTLRMVLFAVQVSQLFGGRYTHPAAAEFMESIASKNVLVQQQSKIRKQSGKSGRSGKSGSKAGKSEFSGASSTTSEERDSALNSKTSMRYGICVGPVTTGVLQGKCPVFDVWGKTVNKASRFEASGRPGNIHVSQLVYDILKDHPKCLIHWEKGHTVYAKGFGNVQGYFMKTTDLLPPKELLLSIGVEPSLGRHYFDENVAEAHRKHMTSSSVGKDGKLCTVEADNLRKPSNTSSEGVKSIVIVDADDDDS